VIDMPINNKKGKVGMKIDFNVKKTEWKWQETIDNFWRIATPIWFDWLQWVLVLGVIGYLAQQTRSIALYITYAFSYGALFSYLLAIFYSFEFKGFPIMKSKRAHRLSSFILSGILSLTVWILLTSLISQIKGKV
jgi:hypothetical protein